MDGAMLPPARAHGAARVSREDWDARAARLPFRKLTVSFMWDSAGLYTIVRGAGVDGPIQVETDAAGGAEPAVNIWVAGWVNYHDYIRTGGLDRLTDVPPADFDRDRARPTAAAGTREDGFFLSWPTLGMPGPPRGPRRISFVICDAELIATPRGGAWLTWGDPPGR